LQLVFYFLIDMVVFEFHQNKDTTKIKTLFLQININQAYENQTSAHHSVFWHRYLGQR